VQSTIGFVFQADCTVRGRANTVRLENVPIINFPRSQCSARMQRTSATCYFAYNDAAVHANARNHPRGTTLSETVAAALPEAIRDFFVSPRHTEHEGKKKEGEREENGSIFPRETAIKKGTKNRENDPDYAGSIIVSQKITSVLSRRRLSKCENRRRNCTRYYR